MLNGSPRPTDPRSLPVFGNQASVGLPEGALFPGGGTGKCCTDVSRQKGLVITNRGRRSEPGVSSGFDAAAVVRRAVLDAGGADPAPLAGYLDILVAAS